MRTDPHLQVVSYDTQTQSDGNLERIHLLTGGFQ